MTTLSRAISCLALLLAGATVGCQKEITQTATPSEETCGATCGDSTARPQLIPAFNPGYALNDVIKVFDNTGSGVLAPYVATSIADWNNAVLSRFNLPRFVTTGTFNKSIGLVWGNAYGNVSNPSQTWYCGNAAGPGGTFITIHRSNDATHCGLVTGQPGTGFRNRTQLAGVAGLIAHELSHMIGFQDHITENDAFPVANCVNSLRLDGGFNPSVCQWEIQQIHLAYGIRSAPLSSNTPIATGLRVSPPALNMTVGNQSVLSLELLFDRGPYVGEGSVPAIGSQESITWSATNNTNPVKVTLSNQTSAGQITATAVAPGTVTVTGDLNSSSRFQKAEPFELVTDLNSASIAILATGPGNVAASAVTAVSATVSWSNSVAGATTKVEYRTGAGAWAVVTAAAGNTSIGLAGLTPLSHYDVQLTHMNGATPVSATTVRNDLFVTLTGPTGVPANLAASNISATGATVSWTNGDGNASTVVQYRVAGGGSYTTAQTVAPGVTSAGLSGLTACTYYDVNVYHTRNGASGTSTSSASLFRTTAVGGGACPLVPPTDFHTSACSTYVYGGKPTVDYTLAWTPGVGNPLGTTFYQVAEAHVNDPAQANILITAKNASTFKITYTIFPYSQDSYFWVRHSNAGGANPTVWVPLVDNPIRVSQGCQL